MRSSNTKLTLFIGPFSPPFKGDGVKNSCLKDGFNSAGLNNFMYFDTICRKGNRWRHQLKVIPLMLKANQLILSLNKQGRYAIIWLFFFLRLFTSKKAVLYVVGGSFDEQIKSMAWLKQRSYVRAINCLDGVFAESMAMKKGLERLGVKNVELVYNPRKDDGSKWSLIPQNRYRLAFISRVTESKGVSVLLDAVQNLVGKGEKISLDLFGPIDDDYADFFNDRIKELSGFVRYGGLIEPLEVQAALTRYHCLVLPTFHSGEGLPGILVEAGMAGTPIIITRFNALPEYFKNEESALFVEPQNTTDLEECIRRLINDDELASKISIGIQKVVEPFMLESVINQSVELFNLYGWVLKNSNHES